jgi:hypothetical protein
MALAGVPVSSPVPEPSGPSGPGGRGRRGRGGGSDDFERLLNQALDRLHSAGIRTDQSFVQQLGNFLQNGLNNAGEQQISLEQLVSRWDQVIEEMIRFAGENQTTYFNMGVFRRIHDILCPGFYPFC